jgi:hypothetical protein
MPALHNAAAKAARLACCSPVCRSRPQAGQCVSHPHLLAAQGRLGLLLLLLLLLLWLLCMQRRCR